MSVLIGQLSREIYRFTDCMASILGLDKPPGSEFEVYQGYSTPMGWNQIAKHLLESKHEYLFTTNDDHIYPPDTITRLMAHQKQAVTGIYLLRQYPFEPVIYDTEHEKVTVEGGRVSTGMSHRYLKDGETTGLVKILVCGDGCFLLHRSVFETVPYPWYILNGPPAPPDQINCDVMFCGKLRAAGIDIYADLEVRIGHIACVPIFPYVRDGKWTTYMSQKNGFGVELGAATQTMRPAMEAEIARLRALK